MVLLYNQSKGVIMGFWSSTWDAVKSVGRSVARVVKKVYEVCTDDSAVDAYDKLDDIINKRDQSSVIVRESAPDFYGEINTAQIDKKISEQNEKLVRHDSEIQESRKIMALQIELTRLRSSAELIDRSMKNVKIHASSLSVHYQNMRNINGLIDNVNDLRHGLKAVIGTINHNANILSNGKTELRKIEGIDVEKKEGAISQVAAYDAFDRTRELLRTEVVELSELSSKHLRDIDRLKINSSNMGGALGGQIIDFVDREIIPIIKQAESAGLLLKSEVSQLPAALREKNGSLVFEHGNIRLEQVN
jgi:hypothetical protein